MRFLLSFTFPLNRSDLVLLLLSCEDSNETISFLCPPLSALISCIPTDGLIIVCVTGASRASIGVYLLGGAQNRCLSPWWLPG